MSDVISYTLQEAIDDGVLAEVFKNRWPELSNGKPIIATSNILDAFSLAALQEIWNEYVIWKKEVKPKLKEEDQLFETKMNDRKVWLMEDGAAFTILFPEDY